MRKTLLEAILVSAKEETETYRQYKILFLLFGIASFFIFSNPIFVAVFGLIGLGMFSFPWKIRAIFPGSLSEFRFFYSLDEEDLVNHLASNIRETISVVQTVVRLQVVVFRIYASLYFLFAFVDRMM